MRKMLYGFIILGTLICSARSAVADVSIGIGIGLPNVSIGINLPLFPELVPVPGYPVYYAPRIDGNYFFYDGMYWVYQDDNWYASSWYNGPWAFVDPMTVPLFVLRVPVSYYRQPPVYFRGWRSDAPPRWGEHWGRSWEERRGGWDRWQRGSVPRPAPLPVYQRQYSGDRYPRAEQQHVIRSQQYRYQPRDEVVRQHFKQTEQKASGSRGKQGRPQAGSPQQQGNQRSAPQQQVAPAGQRQQPQHRGDEKLQKSAPAQAAPQQRAPAAHEQRQQPAPAQHERQPAASPRDQRAPQGQELNQGREQKGGGQEQRVSGQEQKRGGQEQKGGGQEQKRGGQEQKGGGQEQRGGGQEQERGHDKGEGRGGNR